MTRAIDTEQQASEWIIRSETDSFTDEMRADMERWLQNPRNRVIYIRIKEAWRRAGRVRSTRPLDGNVDPDLLKDPNLPIEPPNTNSKPRWPFRIAAAAAGILIIYLGVLVWEVVGPSRWISYTTSIGGYENFTLPDGSSVQLNTDTEVRAHVNAEKREIEVVRGEAMFKVAHDRNRPFKVHAAGASLQVDPPGEAGATFAVRLRTPKSVDISVTSGSVLLGEPVRFIDVALGRSDSLQSTVVAGEIAQARSEGIHLENVGLEELYRKLSWTYHLLTFQGETLTEATDEFNRYNRRHLVVVDPSIANRRIGGAFQATDPESFVSALQKWFNVHANEQVNGDSDSAVILLSKAN